MKNKFLVSTLTLLLFTVILCSYSFATNTNNMMNSAKNAVDNVGTAIGNAAITTRDTIVNGTQNLANDAANLGNDAMNGVENATNDTMNATDANGSMVGINDDANYTATRTATGTAGFLGMSNTSLTTWIILGLVGAIIIGLIWYYNAQYEHKNYNND